MSDLRICFVGDSFVNGTGDGEGFGWAGRICRSARGRGMLITRYDLGVRRDTSSLILRRCAAEVSARLDGRPCDGRVVFSFGANDATDESGRRRVEPADTLANASELLEWSRRRYPTLMIGPPPLVGDATYDARIADLVPALAQVCIRWGVPFLDLHGPLAQDDTWRAEVTAGDGAHPGAGGYARAAAMIEAWEPWRGWTARPSM
mgnify:CR=1 FL=1